MSRWLALMLLTTPLWADQTAATCEEADIQTAIDAASDGETVIVPSGNCTWDASLGVPSINIGAKGIHLKAQGSYSVDGSYNDTGYWPTVITLTDFVTGGYFTSAIAINNPTAAETVQVSGFKFTGGPVYGGTVLRGIIAEASGNEADVLIHNNYSDAGGNFFADSNSYSASTVVFNNYLYENGCSQNGSILFGDRSEDNNGDGAWVYGPDWGGDKWTFVEDNTFWHECDQSGNANGLVDTQAAGRAVIRYNYFRNSFLSNHGSESGVPNRGGIAFEIYGNTIIGWDTGSGNYETAIQFRSGSGRVTDNTVQDFQNLVKGWNARVGTSYGAFEQCDQASPPAWDGNVGGGEPTGYPCLDQVGRTIASGATLATVQPQTQDPLYIWSNSLTNVPSVFKNNDTPSTYMIENDDYYLSAAPGYTKYAYPHPLRSGSRRVRIRG